MACNKFVFNFEDYKNGTIFGVSGDVLETMKSMMNVTVEYIPMSADGPWAQPDIKEKYLGVSIAFVALSDADIILGKKAKQSNKKFNHILLTNLQTQIQLPWGGSSL